MVRPAHVFFNVAMLGFVVATIAFVPGLPVRVNQCVGTACDVQGTVVMDVTTISQFCDPTIFFLVGTEDRVDLTKFALDKPVYHPGDSVSYSGEVRASMDQILANCIGQTITKTQAVPATMASVTVSILGSELHYTPAADGSFAGSYAIPLAQAPGDYLATATASYHGVSKQASAPFEIAAYTPRLEVHSPTGSCVTECIIFPGEKIVVSGFGWIPNSPLIVDVDDKFNVTTDSQGNFQLEVLIPEDSTFPEGAHRINVVQSTLAASSTFQVKYRVLIVTLNLQDSVSQGESVVLSGNVTAAGIGRPVAGAVVNITAFGKSFTAITDNTGAFRISPFAVESQPGSYEVSAIAMRQGYRASNLFQQRVRIMAAMNLPAVSAAIGVGATAGVGLSLAKQHAKLHGKGKPESPFVSPGQSHTQPAISTGADHGQATLGPGGTGTIGSGQSASAQSSQPGIQAGPLILPRPVEFCIHCGLQIKRNSVYCPECRVRLR